MKNFGILFIILACFFLLIGFSYSTIVDTGYTEVHNIGLLNMRSNFIILAMAFFIAGISMIGFDQLKAEVSERNDALELLNNQIESMGTLLTGLTNLTEISNNSLLVTETNRKTPADNDKNVIERETMDILIKKESLLHDTKNKNIDVMQFEWDFIIENKIHEVAPLILDKISNFLSENSYYASPILEKTHKYFSELDPKYSLKYLYDHFEKSVKPPSFYLKLVKELGLVDLNRIFRLLNSNNFELRKFALKILRYHKDHYYPSDIPLYYKIAESLKNFEYPNVPQDNKKWVCYCGQKNSKKIRFCKECDSDSYGFRAYEPKPEEIYKMLGTRVRILKSQFKKV